jgi:hypothetical protein
MNKTISVRMLDLRGLLRRNFSQALRHDHAEHKGE